MADEKDTPQKKAKITDMGKKIGGARKDFSTRALTIADLADMNELEREKYVVRDNIWAFDAREAVKNGMKHGVAQWIKDFRRLFTKPVTSHPSNEMVESYVARAVRDNEKNIEIFIGLVEFFKENFKNVKTKDDLRAALMKFEESGIQFSDVQFNDYQAQRAEFSKWSKIRSIVAHGGNQFYIRDWDSKLTRMDEDEAYGREKLFPEREKPTAVAGAPVTPVRPHHDNLVATNLAERNPDEFLTKFNFSGIEFGNWLPGKEREVVVSHALTALDDLASVLNIDASHISLNGTLSLAFGSRGTKAGMAHYEDARKVIALTRIKGAGSLAHEFGHAIDSFVGCHLNADGYLSQANQVIGETNPVLLAYRKLAGLMCYKQDAKKSEKIYEAHINRVYVSSSTWCNNDFKLANSGITQEGRAEIGKIVDKVFSDEAAHLREFIKNLPADLNRNAFFLAVSENSLKTRGLLQNVQTQCAPYLDGIVVQSRKKAFNAIANNLAVLSQYIFPYYVATHNTFHAANRHDSDFLEQAKLLDGGKKTYFSDGKELLARSFEQYVFYKLKDAGIRSEYLVHSVEHDRFSTDKGYVANPYPSEAERVKLSEAFDELFVAISAELKFKPASRRLSRLAAIDMDLINSTPAVVAPANFAPPASKMLNSAERKKFFSEAEQASIEFSFS